MKTEPKQIYPIKCPHCGENSYWNKDFTLNVFWTSSSKEMKDYESNHSKPFSKDQAERCIKIMKQWWRSSFYRELEIRSILSE